MRIGIDASCWSNPRGYGRFTRALLKALLELDQRNEYVFFMDPETSLRPDLPRRIVARVTGVSEAPVRAASASGSRSLRDIWKMSRSAAEEDLAAFFFPSVYTYFPLLGRQKKIVAIHDVIPEQFPRLVFTTRKRQLFWNLKVRAAIRQADLIITVSDASKKGIMDHYRVSERRLRVVSEAADSVFCPLAKNSEFPETLSRMALDLPRRFILYVGGIAPHKNLSVLVTAFSMLMNDPGHQDVGLVLVGDYQKDVFLIDDRLADCISRLNLDKKVIFAGFRSDDELAHLYNAATVFVLPSLSEGFGLPALEAMSCGTPVVCSRAASLPEVVGDAGLFFDPHRPDELFERLRRVFDDHALREELSRRSLQRAAAFSWSKSALSLFSVFEELRDDAPAA